MASDSLRSAPEAAAQARRLAAALDAIEAQLDTLDLGAKPEREAQALAQPVAELNAAVREAVR